MHIAYKVSGITYKPQNSQLQRAGVIRNTKYVIPQPEVV